MDRLKFLRETRMRHQVEEKKAKDDALKEAEAAKKSKVHQINAAAEVRVGV
jgi:hypothetical protein